MKLSMFVFIFAMIFSSLSQADIPSSKIVQPLNLELKLISLSSKIHSVVALHRFRTARMKGRICLIEDAAQPSLRAAKNSLRTALDQLTDAVFARVKCKGAENMHVFQQLQQEQQMQSIQCGAVFEFWSDRLNGGVDDLRQRVEGLSGVRFVGPECGSLAQVQDSLQKSIESLSEVEKLLAVH